MDPATGRDVPRSYITHLEDRIAELERKLAELEVGSSTTTPESESATAMKRLVSVSTDSGSQAPASYLGGSSGIPFARLMFTAVNFKAQESGPDDQTSHAAFAPASLPSKERAEAMLSAYFSHSNSQLPILHREDFVMRYFEPVYGALSKSTKLASEYSELNWNVLEHEISLENTLYYSQAQSPPVQFHIALYFLNMVFAIASSVHLLQFPSEISEGYKASAVRYMDAVYSSPDRLESLQGILLLACYSTMRPAVPGVWYVLGSALRMCVDMGLHAESKSDLDTFDLDKCRRIFWCTYSLDRQISMYLGRPFGIPEESISVPFPSSADDSLIVRSGISCIFPESYKTVSLSMFRVRKLQAEVQSILYEKRELPRKFENLSDWRSNLVTRLEEWRQSTPKTQHETNCRFQTAFFDLNYHHTRLMVHGLSPKNLTLSVGDCMEVARASGNMIAVYAHLLAENSINYTWVAVHNLFMAGTSYLYAIYHSPQVRDSISLQDIQNHTSQCNTVLSSLVDRCDSAIHCRNTFEILTAAVIRLRYGVSAESMSGDISRNVDSSGNIGGNLKKLVEDLPRSVPDMTRSAPVPDENIMFDWPTNDQQLDQFFQELQSQSPASNHSHPSPQMIDQSPEHRPAPFSSNNVSTSQQRPSTKDGQKVYQMIYQVPTESIWDQLFASPYSFGAQDLV